MKKDEVKKKAITWSRDKKNRMKLKSWIFFSAVGFAVLIYTAFRFAFTREFKVDYIFDLIFLVVVTGGAINDSRLNAEYDEKESNNYFQETNKSLKKEILEVDNHLEFSQKLSKYNQERWEEASFEQRKQDIEDIEDKIATKIDKGKSYKKLQNKVERLRKKDNGEYVVKVKPKNFRKYTKEMFLTVEGGNKKKDVDIDYKSTKVIGRRLFLFSFLRITLFLMLRIGIVAEGGSWFDFFVMTGLVIFSAAGSYLITYDMVREDISNNEVFAKEQQLQKLRYVKSLKVHNIFAESKDKNTTKPNLVKES